MLHAICHALLVETCRPTAITLQIVVAENMTQFRVGLQFI